MIYHLLTTAYGFNILEDGDVRRQPPSPPHDPIVFYIMGDQDNFEHHRTMEVFNHWYRDQSESNGGVFWVDPATPSDEVLRSLDDAAHKKWFVVVKGAVHPMQNGTWETHRHVYAWAGYGQVFEKFFKKVLI